MIHGYAGRLEEELQYYRFKEEEKTDYFVLNSFSQPEVKKDIFFYIDFSRNKGIKTNSLETYNLLLRAFTYRKYFPTITKWLKAKQSAKSLFIMPTQFHFWKG